MQTVHAVPVGRREAGEENSPADEEGDQHAECGRAVFQRTPLGVVDAGRLGIRVVLRHALGIDTEFDVHQRARSVEQEQGADKDTSENQHQIPLRKSPPGVADDVVFRVVLALNLRKGFEVGAHSVDIRVKRDAKGTSDQNERIDHALLVLQRRRCAFL